MSFHLAQVNIAIARYSYGDPLFAGFADNLDRIYALAESTPGFVWRHVTVNNDEDIKQLFGERQLIFNMSVWETKEALSDVVYKGDNAGILRNRADWFVPQNKPTMALWWQRTGTIPTRMEARHRLEHLAQAGPTQDAFTFGSCFEAPTAEEVANG
jgi:hypothetical protein